VSPGWVTRDVVRYDNGYNDGRQGIDSPRSRPRLSRILLNH